MFPEQHVLHIEEPELRFGYGQAMTHPVDGLFLFGPVQHAPHPVGIKVGVIGTRDGIKAYVDWCDRIRKHIAPKDRDKAHHACWPGFEAVFGTPWPAPLAKIVISPSCIAQNLRIENRYEAVFRTASAFADQLLEHKRTEDAAPDLWFVVIPDEVYRLGRPRSRVPRADQIPGDSDIPPDGVARNLLSHPVLSPEMLDGTKVYQYECNFRHQLKARLLDRPTIVQIVRESTLSPPSSQVAGPVRQLQDPATVAWNLCTAAYYKTVNQPWKLASVRPGVCYVGLAYKRDERGSDSKNACCGAQMFLNSGDGVVFRGAIGPWYSPTRKEFHLPREEAESLLRRIVAEYRKTHDDAPPRELFLHSRARFNQDEWAGFCSAVPGQTNLVAVRIRPASDLRLYRPGEMPVIRGTAYLKSQRLGYLWTKGFVPRLQTYPGWEVPKPLLVDVHRGEIDLLTVMSDIMGLTKLNYNSCIFSDGLPVTLRFANMVGEILTAAPVPDGPPLSFRHYI